jgi:DNA-binding response OmpR family regulator
MSNKILLIEDEHAVRGLYAELLANAGYEVDQAPDGDVGFDKIKNTSWDLLLLDIMLPGTDGLKMLRDIQQDPTLKKGPIVVISNLNSEHIIREAISFGADTYLVKSDIDPDKIVSTVKEVLK